MPEDGPAALPTAISRTVIWLDHHNGCAEPELTLRILKVVEEAGEAARAWIGVLGQNPRKGVTHTREDVAAELADTAITALVAIESLGLDPWTVMRDCADKILTRLPEEDRNES
jgi:NTP pyrophosphatase (non-canonical NTP hydrolase)